MADRGPSRRVILRYVLFQLPGIILLGAALLVLHLWVNISLSVAGVILMLWVVKDAALFPFIWRSYRTDQAAMRNSPVGQRGVTREQLSPSGRVRVGGELWSAEAAPEWGELPAGTAVTVREIRGLTLVVEPADGGNRER